MFKVHFFPNCVCIQTTVFLALGIPGVYKQYLLMKSFNHVNTDLRQNSDFHQQIIDKDMNFIFGNIGKPRITSTQLAVMGTN